LPPLQFGQVQRGLTGPAKTRRRQLTIAADSSASVCRHSACHISTAA
jgi:hypothetical protein